MGMYLNIVEYVDVEKQEELLELIDMESRTEGVIEGLINQGKMEGRMEGIIEERKNIINRLLESHSRAEVAKLLGISLTDLIIILDK